eukprot:CAMPEP_0180134382 /NCGR_PEP_ID=MMETSP0986-20121125/10130_1 /TAXON_ID=697907 /ORGANISM="non described non described, Strain CCMP2293" /LENGTH=549 /DNA_ID=CAMNT_0022074735 /DNA_START=102 /DNA_END=1752 /DNA_ORIENTATION=-
MYDLAAGLTAIPRAQPYGRDGGAYFRPLRELMDKDKSYQLTYSIETMGCQMNTADSERIAGQLESMGIIRTEEPMKASVVIYNTCSIRDHAEQKVYSYMGPQAERKRKGESVAIVVAGCVAQQEGESLLRRVPEIDLVMGPQYANRIGDLLEAVMNGNQVVATDAAPIMEDIAQPRRGSQTCAWVNIIYGCNERCTYCVVPTTRGVEQSRPRESIRAELETLAAAGFKEVTLLGQNIDAWGRDMEPKNKFSDLLEHLSDVEGIERIRFTTSHPRYMSLGVVETIAKHPKLCKSIHLPFQSGDDTILKAMGRGHTVEAYLKIIRRIKELMPDAAITADVIVGFPGETEEMFENSMKLMEAVQFDMTNTAAYSPRPNTPAASWHNQLEEKVKADRLQRVMRLATRHAFERSQRYLGRVMEVLVEDRNVKNPAQVKGRIEQGRPVLFEGDIETMRGKLVRVEIMQAEAYYLVGRVALTRTFCRAMHHAASPCICREASACAPGFLSHASWRTIEDAHPAGVCSRASSASRRAAWGTEMMHAEAYFLVGRVAQ